MSKELEEKLRQAYEEGYRGGLEDHDAPGMFPHSWERSNAYRLFHQSTLVERLGAAIQSIRKEPMAEAYCTADLEWVRQVLLDAHFALTRSVPGEASPLDQIVTFGKYKGVPWRQVLERNPDYCRWVVDNVGILPPGVREVLDESLIELEGWGDFDGWINDGL